MAKFDLIKTLSYYGQETTVEGDFIIGEDTIWASRNIVANIFGTTAQNISAHFKNIIEEGELNEKEVSISSKDLFKEQTEFSKKNLQKSKNRGRPQIWYNLDAMISIGYRINSKEATHFRKWATQILKEYMIKGFALNDEALKNGGILRKDYFEELLIRIREIRLSEYRLYGKILEIYAQCSYDYNKEADITKEFFANVQNKLHYALTGQTAAERIKNRADPTKPHMGLNAWKSSSDGKIYSYDITVAKNYLNNEKIENLSILMDSFLNVAELRARNRIPTSMKEWAGLLEDFIKLNQYPVLDGNGNISKRDADIHAKKEYELYLPIQEKLIKSEFEKLMEKTQERLK